MAAKNKYTRRIQIGFYRRLEQIGFIIGCFVPLDWIAQWNKKKKINHWTIFWGDSFTWLIHHRLSWGRLILSEAWNKFIVHFIRSIRIEAYFFSFFHSQNAINQSTHKFCSDFAAQKNYRKIRRKMKHSSKKSIILRKLGENLKNVQINFQQFSSKSQLKYRSILIFNLLALYSSWKFQPNLLCYLDFAIVNFYSVIPSLS